MRFDKSKLDSMTEDAQKQLLSDTLASSLTPLIEMVVRQRCRQWVDEIHAVLTKPDSKVAVSTPKEEVMTKEQIEYMVQRFLSWRLPESFNPDGGISFKRTFNEHLPSGPCKHEPSGTNLLDHQQATAMVQHMIDGMPKS